MFLFSTVIYPAADPTSRLFAGIGTAFMSMWIMTLIVNIISLIGLAKMYQKAGKPMWAVIVPFYSEYVLFQIVYGEDKGWHFLKLLIPFYNIYVAIKLYLDLAKVYGQGTGFGIGLIFVPVVFYCILGFGSAVYQRGRSYGSYTSDEARMAALNKLREKRRMDDQ